MIIGKELLPRLKDMKCNISDECILRFDSSIIDADALHIINSYISISCCSIAIISINLFLIWIDFNFFKVIIESKK